MNERKIKKTEIIFCISILLSLLIFGTLLRFHRLDAWDFWEDEYLTEERAHFDEVKVFKNKVTSIFPVFYSINSLNCRSITSLYKVPVLNEVQLRWPMALAGVFGILAIFLAVRKISGNIAGLLAAFITCFSIYHIYYSREARYYAFFFLATVWIVHATWNCINSKFFWKNYLIYSIAAAFGLGIHQGCYFLVAITNIYLMIWECSRGVQCLKQHTMKLSHVFVRLVVVLCFLVLPLLTCWPIVSNTLNGVTKSVKSTSIEHNTIDNLRFETVVDLQADFWKHLVSKNMATVLLFLPLILIFSKRYWNILILYILVYTIPLITLNHLDKKLLYILHSKYIVFIFAMSIIAVCVAIGFVIDLFLNSIKYKKWNSYFIFAVLSLFTVAFFIGLVRSNNKIFKNSKYAVFYKEREKGPEKLFAYLNKNSKANDIIIGSEEPWRGGLCKWQIYWLKRSDLNKTNKLYRPTAIFENFRGEVFWPPRKVYCIMSCGMTGLSNNKLNKKFNYRFFQNGKYVLVQTKKPCFTKKELVENTIELYKAYYSARKQGDRRAVYGTIASELESWLRQHKPYSSNTLGLVETYRTAYLQNTLNSVPRLLLSLSSINISNVYKYKINTSTIEYGSNIFDQSIVIIPKPIKENTITISFTNEPKYNILEFDAFISVKNKWPYETFEVYGDGQLLKKPIKINAQKEPRLLRYNIVGRNVIQIKIKVGRIGYSEKIILANPILKTESFNWHDIKNITSTNFYKMVLKNVYRKGDIEFKNALVVVPTPEGTSGNIFIPLNKNYKSFSTQISVDVNNSNPYEAINIYGDDKKLDCIKKIGPNTPPAFIEINVENIDLLRIEVTPGLKGYYEKIFFSDAKFEPKKLEKMQ